MTEKSIIEKAIEEEYKTGECTMHYHWKSHDRLNIFEADTFTQRFKVDLEDFARNVSSRSISDLLDEISKEIKNLKALPCEECSKVYGKDTFHHYDQSRNQTLTDVLKFLQKKKQELEK